MTAKSTPERVLSSSYSHPAAVQREQSSLIEWAAWLTVVILGAGVLARLVDVALKGFLAIAPGVLGSDGGGTGQRSALSQLNARLSELQMTTTTALAIGLAVAALVTLVSARAVLGRVISLLAVALFVFCALEPIARPAPSLEWQPLSLLYPAARGVALMLLVVGARAAWGDGPLQGGVVLPLIIPVALVAASLPLPIWFSLEPGSVESGILLVAPPLAAVAALGLTIRGVRRARMGGWLNDAERERAGVGWIQASFVVALIFAAVVVALALSVGDSRARGGAVPLFMGLTIGYQTLALFFSLAAFVAAFTLDGSEARVLAVVAGLCFLAVFATYSLLAADFLAHLPRLGRGRPGFEPSIPLAVGYVGAGLMGLGCYVGALRVPSREHPADEVSSWSRRMLISSLVCIPVVPLAIFASASGEVPRVVGFAVLLLAGGAVLYFVASVLATTYYLRDELGSTRPSAPSGALPRSPSTGGLQPARRTVFMPDDE